MVLGFLVLGQLVLNYLVLGYLIFGYLVRQVEEKWFCALFTLHDSDLLMISV